MLHTFGIAHIRTALARAMANRENKERKLCDVCNQRFTTFEDTEEHRRKAHPEVAV